MIGNKKGIGKKVTRKVFFYLALLSSFASIFKGEKMCENEQKEKHKTALQIASIFQKFPDQRRNPVKKFHSSTASKLLGLRASLQNCRGSGLICIKCLSVESATVSN